MIKPRKKTVRNRVSKNMDTKYLGEEPTWSDVPSTQYERTDAYNWYNYFCNQDDAIKYLVTYLKGQKRTKDINAIKALPKWKVSNTIGFLARMLDQGCIVDDETMDYFNGRISEMVKEAKKLKVEKKEIKSEPVLSIQDRIREQVSDLIAEVEEAVDVVANGNKTDFSMYDFLKNNEVKGPQTSRILDYYKPLQDELTTDDKQVKEAYSRYTKTGYKKLMDFVNKIVEDTEMWLMANKATRKPRKKKTVAANKQIEKLKFKKEDSNFKIKSVSPESIIGASQLWVFNTKYKKLAVYNAEGPKGFSVKGTTLQDFSTETSMEKIVRKPEDVLPDVLKGGKVKLRKILTNLKTKEATPTGRMNDDTILLRVIK